MEETSLRIIWRELHILPAAPSWRIFCVTRRERPNLCIFQLEPATCASNRTSSKVVSFPDDRWSGNETLQKLSLVPRPTTLTLGI